MRNRSSRIVVLASAIVLAALTAGCSYTRADAGDDTGASGPVATVTTTTLQEVETVAMDDFTVAIADDWGQSLASTTAAALEIDLGSRAVLTFDVADAVPEECVSTVALQLRMTETADLSRHAVYPSRLAPADHTVGQEIDSQLLLDNRPRGLFEVTDDVATADITDLYRLWVTSTGFPSKGLRPPDPTRLVLVVQLESMSYDLAHLRSTFHSTESPSPPVLQISRSC